LISLKLTEVDLISMGEMLFEALRLSGHVTGIVKICDFRLEFGGYLGGRVRVF
jgi:hypothetical protein